MTVMNRSASDRLDATFLARRHREIFESLALKLGADYLILEAFAPDAEIIRRLAMRKTDRQEPSDADEQIFRQQALSIEPLTSRERRRTIKVNTGDKNWDRNLLATLKTRMS